jgi:NADH-quinone oxidoreductase subunit L
MSKVILPTPVSSLLHAATLVMAGIYFLLSLNSVLSASSIVLTCAVILGTITALFAASTAIVQNDIKRVVAYSTCSQFGYLFASVGLSQSSSTVLHLSSHAGFKALLFICAGGVIHSMKDQ